jgi:hypothetical protein
LNLRDDRTGEIIGRGKYKINKFLGGGQYGSVFLVENLLTKKEFVLNLDKNKF